MKQIKFNEMRENTEEGETRLYRISNNNNGSAHTHKKEKKNRLLDLYKLCGNVVCSCTVHANEIEVDRIRLIFPD